MDRHEGSVLTGCYFGFSGPGGGGCMLPKQGPGAPGLHEDGECYLQLPTGWPKLPPVKNVFPGREYHWLLTIISNN